MRLTQCSSISMNDQGVDQHSRTPQTEIIEGTLLSVKTVPESRRTVKAACPRGVKNSN
jgi:hypothetical protein